MAASQERLIADLTKVRRHVRILLDIGRLVGEYSDLDRLLDQVVVQVARALEIDHVKVLKYRPNTADLLIIAGIGWKEGVVGVATLPADMRSAPGRAFQTAQAVTIRNFDGQTEFTHSPLLKDHGIVSLLNVPLMIGGAAWGVMEVDSTVPCDFSEDTSDFLTAAGVMVGTFLHREASGPSELVRLAAAAAEAQGRDILLREMQHRVKNNFQLILSAISQQKRRHGVREVQQALDHIASRINALSLAHDQLAPRKDGQVVKLSDYIRALASSIRQQAEGVEIDVVADELELTIDRAVPLGLILNEAATNSLKHAFGAAGGRISVRLEGGVGYGEGRLTIADNGRGMGEPGQIGSPGGSQGGFGLKLIASLARQIGGTAEQQSAERGGTVTVVQFPLGAQGTGGR